MCIADILLDVKVLAACQDADGCPVLGVEPEGNPGLQHAHL